MLRVFQDDIETELWRRRGRVLVGIIVTVFLVLVARVWILQIFDGDRFSYLSENNRIRLKRMPGTRGMVFDRRGGLLVDSRASYDLLFVPEDAPEGEATLRHLARLLDWDEDETLNLAHGNGNRLPFEEIVLGRDVDWSTVIAVESHQLDLPGVTLRIRPRRSYVGGGIASHLLGYIGEISRPELKARTDAGYEMGDEIGKFGLEKHWEPFLRGYSGGQQVEVDALGRRVRVLHEISDVPGNSVLLTLDRDVQEAAHQALRGKEGAIVVLDVHTGAVVAMASAPVFDPNTFARGITAKEWRDLVNDPMAVLNNRVVQGQYPPGSAFKIVLAIAALEEGVIDPESAIFDPGFHAVGNRVFRDWKKGGHGAVNLHRGVVESCDVYFYQLGLKLGIDRIAKYARLLGLGEPTGIELDHEKGGLIPDSEWKQRRFGEPWYNGETPSVSIGQGYVTVTPLQMANLMAAVANGGTLYRPWFVQRVESLDGALIREYRPAKIRSVALNPDTLRRVHAALRDVVNGPAGTGGFARSKLVPVAGKTGTAQVAEMKGAYVKSEQLAYEVRDHAWFVAYAPADRPQIAAAVLVEHGGHGGSAAAPLAKQVIEKYFSVRQDAPDQRLAKLAVEVHAD